ncbi:MAG: flagellar hook-associated protein FlgK [Dissulfurispiraceae bacterium]|jgi:flagellar hook-associated protein 1 FlgK|nr:flagellar hook-associated protein FlgK [Dissulfurispiraceae bacterium]
MGISGLFDIGKTALLTTRKALDTVGNNIANASTPGYSRQEVVLENIPSGIFSSTGLSGRGVRISDVQRMYSSYVSLQMRNESSLLSYYETYNRLITQIEDIFNESSDYGISPSISSFFNAWDEVAQYPDGYAQRAQLLQQAETLTVRISQAANTLVGQRSEILKSTKDLIDKTNTYLNQLYDLNEKIAASPGALDLKDQRDYTLEQLGKILNITSYEDNSGRYAVLIGGTPLLDGGIVYKMKAELTGAGSIRVSVDLPTGDVDITNTITNGELKANLQMRDSIIPDYLTKLNAMAINIADQVNYYHRQGIGLDSSTGNNFFNDLYSVTDNSASGEITSLTISSSVAYGQNPGKIYQIDYDMVGGADYQQEAASGIYWRVRESSDDGATWSAIPTASVAISVDTAASPESRTLIFNGIKVRIDADQTDLISDAAGSFDSLSLSRNASSEMQVALTDPNKIAAAMNAALLPGDNTNAKILADLFNQTFMEGSTITAFYTAIVSTVGASSSAAAGNLKFQTALVKELETRRQELSGVSLDEEAAKLLIYQRSYEAAAKMITVADELFQTILAMTGR